MYLLDFDAIKLNRCSRITESYCGDAVEETNCNSCKHISHKIIYFLVDILYNFTCIYPLKITAMSAFIVIGNI